MTDKVAMAEYIDREEVLKFIEEHMTTVAKEIRNKNTKTERIIREIYLLAKDHAKQWVSIVPTADVAEVKHGYWKDTEYGTCSVCDRSISEIYDADSCMAYGILDELTACPFCGAKMDGKVGDKT